MKITAAASGVHRRTAYVLAALASFALLASTAKADITFGPQGSAAGQTNTPAGLAVVDSTGEVFVSDRLNKRIDVFDAAGNFIRAFGWGVDSGANALEVCTTASTCQAGLFGSGAGQFGVSAQPGGGGPAAIAVDNDPASPSYHDIYVFDSENARIQRFHPSGAFVLAFGDGVNQTSGGDVCPRPGFPGDTCGAGVLGSAPGQLNNNVQLAIGLGGTIYVADNSFGAAGWDRRVQTFDSSGALTGQPLTLTATEQNSSILFLAADSAGDFYLATEDLANEEGIRKYDSSGTCVGYCASPVNPSFNFRGFAVDRSSGKIFVSDDGGVGIAGAINLYDPAGTLLSVIYGDEIRGMTALAARHTASGDFYAVESDGNNSKIVHVPIPPLGPVVLPDPATKADPIGNSKATLNAIINPEGNATTYHFEYISNADYIVNGGGFSGAHPAATTPELAVGSDFSPYAETHQITGLAPETLYRFRAVASDGTHTTNGPEATFTTREPFELGDIYSTEVGTGSATLNAELNPLGIAAGGYFEYVDDATYQADIATGDGFQHAAQVPDVDGGDPPLDFGDANDELVTSSAQLHALAQDTTYHYRLVATNSFTTKPGPENVLHTFAPLSLNTDCPANQQFRSGPSAALPNCRAYEMVSPLDKQGADIRALGVNSLQGIFGSDRAQIRQARPDGSALTYSSYRSFADPVAAPWTSQYLASRDPQSGWGNVNITPSSSPLSFIGDGKYDTRFKAFSEDLCSAYFLQDTDVALAPGDQAGFVDLYRERNCEDPVGYELLTGTPPSNQTSGEASTYFPRVQGFSADNSRAIFRANAKLATSGTAASSAIRPTKKGTFPIFQLYLNSGAGSMRLVSVMPDGSAADLDSSVGNYSDNTNNALGDTLSRAVSEDGTRVFWTASPTVGDGAAFAFTHPKLYLRINANVAQSPISAGQCTDPGRACTLAVSESVDSGRAVFWTATPQGSEALFSLASGPHAGELYSYDVATQAPTLITGGLQGVLGASEDLTKIYLVSTEDLGGGPNPQGDAAVAGHSNLYFYRQGQGFRFIADVSSVLSSFSASNKDGTNAYGQNPAKHLARVSPDGDHAAFFSIPSPIGYDNADAASGEPDGEVYLYDAGANGGAGELHCASCNPSGARPVGRKSKNPDVTFWAASVIPNFEYSLHASRVLSDDGRRLFFLSFDALLPTDANGAQDVYQWEAPGSGDCDSADANYFAQNGGCLSLISSGQSPQDSEFIDASADGSDVFLLTGQQLFAGDSDTLIDIYDARVNGGFPAPQSTPPCDLNAGACEGLGSAAPGNTGAGSAVFEGPGNENRSSAKTCKRGAVKRHGKCVKRPAKRRHKRADKKSHTRATSSSGRTTK